MVQFSLLSSTFIFLFKLWCHKVETKLYGRGLKMHCGLDAATKEINSRSTFFLEASLTGPGDLGALNHEIALKTMTL